MKTTLQAYYEQAKKEEPVSAELEFKLYQMAGLHPTDTIAVCDLREQPRDAGQQGWTLVVDYDQFSTALYHEGHPVSGFVYTDHWRNQDCGGYLHSTCQYFISGGKEGRDWKQCRSSAHIMAALAKEFLLQETVVA